MVFIAVSLRPELPPPLLLPPEREDESTSVEVGMTVCEVLVPILVSPFVMVVNVVRTCEVTLVGTRVVCGVDDADVNSEVSDVG